MKIGDMVELSAAGKRRRHNSNYNVEGAYGMIVEYKTDAFPIKCIWYGSSMHYSSWDNLAPFKAYELKRKRT